MTKVLTNRSASRAQLQIGKAHDAREHSVRRLSAGKRITTAADDQAGLKISTRMSSRGRALNLAVRNANDGVAMLDVADASASGAAEVLGRMRELALLAANETAATSDRNAMQFEFSNLLAELDRMAADAEFNTHKLLDGSLQDAEFHIGADAGQTISVSIADLRANSLGRRAFATAAAAVNATALAAGDVTINGTAVGATSADDDTVSSTLASASAIAKARAVNRISGLTGVAAEVGVNVVTGAADVSASSLVAGDLVINGRDVGDINGILANDVGDVLISAINAVSSDTGVVASHDSASGRITLTADDGRNVDLVTNGAASTFFTAGVHQSTLELTSREDFIVGGLNPGTLLGINATRYVLDVTTGLGGENISTRAGANASLEVIDAALERVVETRSDLGALRNRLERTINSLHSSIEYNQTSQSRIQDADYAAETAELTRADVVLNAGVAVLAQAINDPRAVLRLIG